MAKLSVMMTKPLMLAIAFGTLASAAPSAAQPVRDDWRGGETWNRETFWRDAPTGLRERIDWLQQRIDRGLADGSLDRREARQIQYEIDSIEREAMALERRLDDASRRIRWLRRNDNWRGGYRDRNDPYGTDYDAARDYREGGYYTERRMGENDEIYRGSDGRYYCKRSDGTTGLVVGMIGGAAIGNVIDGGRNRVAGTLFGGALGALLGQSIDRNSDVRCR